MRMTQNKNTFFADFLLTEVFEPSRFRGEAKRWYFWISGSQNYENDAF